MVGEWLKYKTFFLTFVNVRMITAGILHIERSNWRGGVWCNSMQTVRSQHMATDCQEHDSAFMSIVVAC